MTQARTLHHGDAVLARYQAEYSIRCGSCNVTYDVGRRKCPICGSKHQSDIVAKGTEKK